MYSALNNIFFVFNTNLFLSRFFQDIFKDFFSLSEGAQKKLF